MCSFEIILTNILINFHNIYFNQPSNSCYASRKSRANCGYTN